MLINNGRGVEFHTYKHSASKFGDDTDKFIAAYGHNGRQSSDLVKNMSDALGFNYITASTKEEFLSQLSIFISTQITSKPMIFELFIEKVDDSDVLRLIRQINGKPKESLVKQAYSVVGQIFGDNVANTIKSFLHKWELAYLHFIGQIIMAPYYSAMRYVGL